MTVARRRRAVNGFSNGTRFINCCRRHRAFDDRVLRRLRCFSCRLQIRHEDEFVRGGGLQVRDRNASSNCALLLSTQGAVQMAIYLIRRSSTKRGLYDLLVHLFANRLSRLCQYRRSITTSNRIQRRVGLLRRRARPLARLISVCVPKNGICAVSRGLSLHEFLRRVSKARRNALTATQQTGGNGRFTLLSKDNGTFRSFIITRTLTGSFCLSCLIRFVRSVVFHSFSGTFPAFSLQRSIQKQ